MQPEASGTEPQTERFVRSARIVAEGNQPTSQASLVAAHSANDAPFAVPFCSATG